MSRGAELAGELSPSQCVQLPPVLKWRNQIAQTPSTRPSSAQIVDTLASLLRVLFPGEIIFQQPKNSSNVQSIFKLESGRVLRSEFPAPLEHSKSTPTQTCWFATASQARCMDWYLVLQYHQLPCHPAPCRDHCRGLLNPSTGMATGSAKCNATTN